MFLLIIYAVVFILMCVPKTRIKMLKYFSKWNMFVKTVTLCLFNGLTYATFYFLSASSVNSNFGDKTRSVLEYMEGNMQLAKTIGKVFGTSVVTSQSLLVYTVTVIGLSTWLDTEVLMHTCDFTDAESENYFNLETTSELVENAIRIMTYMVALVIFTFATKKIKISTSSDINQWLQSFYIYVLPGLFINKISYQNR